ncbi:MAG: dodecin family protein [Nitrospirota bacterium]|nr:dodecin family protein [Nitrospirota bacterium]
MTDHIYKHIEITGTSPDSIEAAVGAAVARAHRSVRHMRWFEVLDTRGHIQDGRVAQWQVTIKIGFTLEE